MTVIGNTTIAESTAISPMLAWSLRLFGGIDLLAIFAVLMPLAWMKVGHQWCGLGPFPEGPLPEYLSRSTALLWAMHGALLIFLSLDVERNMAVIRFVAVTTILAGLSWLAIDVTTGIPLWWTALEGPLFALSGGWYLWCLPRRTQRQ